MVYLNRNERPLGIVLIAKDDTPERILFKYPYVIDIPVAHQESESSSNSNENLNKAEYYSSDDENKEKKGEKIKCAQLDMCNKRVDTSYDGKEKREDRTPCFPVKMLAALLQPKKEVRGVPFEIKVDNVRYAGVPWQVNQAGQCIAIIFVLPGGCSNCTVDAFQSLSRKMVVAIHNEQQRCGFLKEQIQVIQALLDKAESSDDENYVPFQDIEEASKLAQSLREVYEDICSYGIVDVFINDCIQVGFCIEPKSLSATLITPNPSRDVDILMKAVQPYHTVLFFEDCVPSPDCNPFVLKFFQHYDIEKSIEEISISAKMPLQQMKDVVRHYLLWARAKVIYPLCGNNVYCTAQSEIAPVGVHATFNEQFPEVSLSKILSYFNLPYQLSDFLTTISWHTDLKIKKQMLIFILRNGFLTQLHTFFFLIPPLSNNAHFQTPPPDKETSLLSPRVKATLKMVEDPQLKNWLLRVSCDVQEVGFPESDYFFILNTFISLQPFLNGTHHLEAIMYHKRIDRTTLTKIFDTFHDLIQTFQCVDQIVDEVREEDEEEK